ncbi:hypothetical protein GQ42DRAFT_156884 [Ramicandelaber brevisporus]|nr:hypothetical protein GQ42DRAFT_156884 [Ramicandelaber brevisporus]
MELLHMLPKLKEVTIRYCAVEDGDATLDVLNRISSDISDKLYKRAIELYYFDYLDDREGWTAELFIAMAAAAPKLKSLVIDHPQYEIADPVWLVYPKILSEQLLTNSFK